MTRIPPDCCPGEPAHGDPHGMHTFDCPVYLANMAALERWNRNRADNPPPETQTLRQAGLIAQWDAWQCQACGCRYGQPYDQHGAPGPCGGELEPVTVTITRRSP